jgi:hypothetical protein
MKSFFSFLALLAVVACGKKSDYVYVGQSTDALTYSETHAIIDAGNKVDILWIIDNSLSMQPIQATVIQNVNSFMQEFTKKNLDWKMGLISTDRSDRPYLGFDTPFTYQTPNPVQVFTTAANRLGTHGSGTEQEYDPAYNNLTAYPNFTRPKTHLIMIVVSDETEQSNMTTDQFLDFVWKLKGNKQLFKTYGALNAVDFGCKPYDSNSALTYAGSPFEDIIKKTNGKVYSTCSANFGLKLASLSKDIISTVTSPVILLKARPVSSTLKIHYKGDYLPGGSLEDHGMWIYDPENNSVRFHNLDFVDFDFKDVKIVFDVDQGQASQHPHGHQH